MADLTDAFFRPDPDSEETATRSRNFERYKRVEKRIKKELPRLVRQRVERKFEKIEADMVHGISDISEFVYLGTAGDGPRFLPFVGNPLESVPERTRTAREREREF